MDHTLPKTIMTVRLTQPLTSEERTRLASLITAISLGVHDVTIDWPASVVIDVDSSFAD